MTAGRQAKSLVIDERRRAGGFHLFVVNALSFEQTIAYNGAKLIELPGTVNAKAPSPA